MTTDAQRTQELRRILEHERTLALERVRELRAEQEEDVVTPPADELDTARSLADVETHATLIEQLEQRLKAIDLAFNRLEQGQYGICAECGKQIALERLKTLPFASYCQPCQEARNHLAHPSKEWIEEPLIHRWDPPEEMKITTESPRDESSPGPEELAIEIVTEDQLSTRTARRAKKRAKDRAK
ncbi:MAG TPA: TraR/DksA family transcriptional regulator [Terriglobales bacterium]|nr:TraR/DksA family transcriptional regulator [Terriglobales bacterium]